MPPIQSKKKKKLDALGHSAMVPADKIVNSLLKNKKLCTVYLKKLSQACTFCNKTRCWLYKTFRFELKVFIFYQSFYVTTCILDFNYFISLVNEYKYFGLCLKKLPISKIDISWFVQK